MATLQAEKLDKIQGRSFTIFFAEQDHDIAHLIRHVCDRTAHLLQEKWQLSLPAATQVHIMRSWCTFPFNASSWSRKVLLAAAFPLWAIKAKRLWAFSGGWAIPHPRKPAIGIKPPDLLQVSDRSMGQRIFIDDMDTITKVQSIASHELTHAATAHLKLPAWLNEGIAMVTVDAVFERGTVKPVTLESLKTTQPKVHPRSYRQLRIQDKEALVYLYVRGYWITRFFVALYPDVLLHVLSRRHSAKSIESLFAEALGISRSDFWQRIDSIVVTHFGSKLKVIPDMENNNGISSTQ